MAKGREKETGEDEGSMPTIRTVERKVRFVSMDKRYQRMPYPFTVAVSQTSGKFITGQEHILSEAKMRGLEKLSATDKRQLMMGNDPFIIHPDNVYMLQALRTFNLSYEINGPGEEDRTYLVPKDFAEYTFFMQQEKVADSKAKYQKNKHFFYLEDKEKEAAEELALMDMAFEAENFIRTKLTVDRYKEVILLMNYMVPKYNIDPRSMTEIQIRSEVLKACKEHPDMVLKLAKKDNEVLLFVLKLMYYKIIERRNGTDFYAGETYIGSTLDAVKLFCTSADNTQLITKWGNMIKSRES